MTNQNERFSLNNNMPKTFIRYYDIMPHVSIVTSLINLLRPNNNMNLNIQKNIDIMPLVNIMTSPNEWFRLSKNRNKALHLICHYATCHYHICCLFHMWVVGGHTMLKHVNKDVYIHVTKSQPLLFHIQDNCINKLIIVIIYYVGDMWQHTIGTKSLII